MNANISAMRLVLFAVACGAISPSAQTTADSPEMPCLIPESEPGALLLTWQGMTGRTYFIQYSEDLVHWSYVPTIEAGRAGAIEYHFTSTSPAFFIRLRYTDQPAGDRYAADFDHDGVGNWVEIQRGMNPMVADSDTDGDGMPDDWELAHGLNPGDPTDADSDSDGDGLRAKDEITFGLDPRIADASTTSEARSVYTYTANDELSTYQPWSGGATAYNPDAEGNLQP